MSAKLVIACILFVASRLALGVGAGADTVIAGCFMESDFRLTTVPGGTAPIPDGVPIEIYLDRSGNGPDSTDALLPICDFPPDCPTGPAGTFNLNTTVMNGGGIAGQEGYFFMDPCLVPIGMLPGSNRIYFRLDYPPTRWTSNVIQLVIGPQDEEIAAWTPSAISLCDPADSIVVLPIPSWQNPQPHACVCLCPGASGGHVAVYVGPFPPWCRSQYPGTVAGPLYITSGGDCQACTPAGSFTYNPGLWQWAVRNGQDFVRNDVSLPAVDPGGSVTIWLDALGGFPDCWLPVSFGSFTATPLDHAVRLDWNTHSETDAARFDLFRDELFFRSVEAGNTATGLDYSVTDHDVENGTTYYYRLTLVNADGNSNVLASASAAPSADHTLVGDYALHQNYPNPFNPATQIRYDLVEANTVRLRVYNTSGQQVAELADGPMIAGTHTAIFDAAALPSGVYYYTLTVGSGFTATKKMLLIK